MGKEIHINFGFVVLDDRTLATCNGMASWDVFSHRHEIDQMSVGMKKMLELHDDDGSPIVLGAQALAFSCLFSVWSAVCFFSSWCGFYGWFSWANDTLKTIKENKKLQPVSRVARYFTACQTYLWGDRPVDAAVFRLGFQNALIVILYRYHYMYALEQRPWITDNGCIGTQFARSVVCLDGFWHGYAWRHLRRIMHVKDKNPNLFRCCQVLYVHICQTYCGGTDLLICSNLDFKMRW